jgi:N-glycosylase/DNA lyase
MTPRQKRVKDLEKTYAGIRKEIGSRLKEFARLGKKGTEKEIFSEMVFCMFTPQSRAEACWKSVQALSRNYALFRQGPKQIARQLCGVRFHNNKALYVVQARKKFLVGGKISLKSKLRGFNNPQDARDWFVLNVKGLGYKEASHFLRNIGMGRKLAILDRHILKNLVILDVIPEIPKSMTRSKYLEIEKRMDRFSRKVKIPLDHLDLLLWYMETGKIFK